MLNPTPPLAHLSSPYGFPILRLRAYNWKTRRGVQGEAEVHTSLAGNVVLALSNEGLLFAAIQSENDPERLFSGLRTKQIHSKISSEVNQIGAGASIIFWGESLKSDALAVGNGSSSILT